MDKRSNPMPEMSTKGAIDAWSMVTRFAVFMHYGVSFLMYTVKWADDMRAALGYRMVLETHYYL